jgi:hypothetical protein
LNLHLCRALLFRARLRRRPLLRFHGSPTIVAVVAMLHRR